MKLPTRKRQSKQPTSLPKDFLRTVAELFGEQFKSGAKGSTFLVYGDLYGDEAILCVSLGHPKSLQSASMHISTDLAPDTAEHPEKVTDRLKSMVDVAASWFAQSLEGGKGLESVLSELEDMDTAWQEFEWDGATLFVKINRANYTLERAADDFLKNAGFDLEAEDMLDEIINDDSSDGGGSGPLN